MSDDLRNSLNNVVTTVAQPTLAPTRKILFTMIAAGVLVAINKSLPAIFPMIASDPALAPLYEVLVQYAPLMVAATGYMTKEAIR